MSKVRISGPARRDISKALTQSLGEFGPEANERYRLLLDQAFKDLGEDPRRVGVRAMDDVREGYFTYHLRSSVRRAPKPSVRRPRHLIAFRFDERGDVLVMRVFHERQMLNRHLGEET